MGQRNLSHMSSPISPEVQRSGGVVGKTFSLGPHHPDVTPLVPESEHIVVGRDEANLSIYGLGVAVYIHRGCHPKRRGADRKFPRLGP